MILCFPDKTQKERLKFVKLYIYSYIEIITFFNTFQKNYSIASIALSKGQKVIEVKVSQERVTNKNRIFTFLILFVKFVRELSRIFYTLYKKYECERFSLPNIRIIC